MTTGTRHFEFAYPAFTRSVGVHFKPWGWAPFVGIPGSEVCDLQLAVEQVWGRYGDELLEEPGRDERRSRRVRIRSLVLRRDGRRRRRPLDNPARVVQGDRVTHLLYDVSRRSA